MNQLARRVSNLELDIDVVKSQVAAFKSAEAAILKKLASGGPKAVAKEEIEESAVAKLSEEMKSLPSRVAERLAEVGDPFRKRRMRRFHPMMFEEIMHMSEPGDPVGVLMAASLVRDEMPWLYELAMEVYRTVKDGDVENIENEMRRIRRISEFSLRGPFMEEFGNKDTHMIAMEFPRMLERTLMRAMEVRATEPRLGRKAPKDEG